MLRIDRTRDVIPVDFDDDYLELVTLLVEAAGLEHSLMTAYLYALFSIKDEHAEVRGDLALRSFLEHPPAGRFGSEVLLEKDSFLDVAIEEMQHLGIVNGLLRELGAAPCLMPHLFPYSSDIYPFALELRSLDRYVAATYLWIEAGQCELSLKPGCDARREPEAFIREVRRVLKDGAGPGQIPIDDERVNHVGSLYGKVLEYLQRVRANPPPGLPRDFAWGAWEDRMTWIRDQGEITHYRFFRDVFTGEAFGGDASIWKPGPSFPARTLPWRTAYSGRRDSIESEDARQLAWLSNLLYWILLSLLDLAYRMDSRKLRYEAIEQMTLALWWLGLELAGKHGVGLPFDPIGPRYTLGRDDRQSLAMSIRLVEEASRKAKLLGDRGLLPERFDRDLFERTLEALKTVG